MNIDISIVDDFTLNCILEQIGRDPITLRNLRATCRRWKNVVDTFVPIDRDQSLYWTIYRALKNEQLFVQSVAPLLAQIMSNPNTYQIRAQILRNREKLLIRSADAPTSRIFREIWSLLWDPDERHIVHDDLRTILHWDDAEELCDMFIRDCHGPQISIDTYVREFAESSIQDPLHICHIIEHHWKGCRNLYLISLLKCAALRRLFVIRADLRARIIDDRISYVIDLMTAQEIANISDIHVNYYNVLQVITAHRGRIPRDILDALFARVGEGVWKYLLLDFPIDKLEPNLRQGLENLFAQPIEIVAAQNLFASLIDEQFPSWKCIEAVRRANGSLLDNETILGVIISSFQLSHNPQHHVARRYIIAMIKMRFDPAIILQFMARARLSLANQQHIVGLIIDESSEIKDARKYARLIAANIVQQKRKAIHDRQIIQQKRGTYSRTKRMFATDPHIIHRTAIMRKMDYWIIPIWRELYADLGYRHK